MDWQRSAVLIAGGMGVRISGWRLAQALARCSRPGLDVWSTVSGTALGVVCARDLQDGDPGGHLRRAFAALSRIAPGVSTALESLVERFFIPGGKPPAARYRAVPFSGPGAPRWVDELNVAGAFAEVWLAREGHRGIVGINLLTKIQAPTLPTLWGAILAGVDFVAMGAGVPSEIPRVLDGLSHREPVRLKLSVSGASRTHETTLAPADYLGDAQPVIGRPQFLAIVASHQLAVSLAGDEATRPDGFIVEGPIAGGHNAPPRGSARDPLGQPVYGAEDEPDLRVLAATGLPFWLAGGYATAGKLADALDAGAAGIQAGTLFALCNESGMRPDLRAALADRIWSNRLTVLADPRVSPSGYPFQVAALPGTIADPEVFAARRRACDVGCLHGYRERSDEVVRLCPAEPIDSFLRKGGWPERLRPRWRDAAAHAGCLCNALLATCGLGQPGEPAIVTLGQDFHAVRQLQVSLRRRTYSASEAVDAVAGLVPTPPRLRPVEPSGSASATQPPAMGALRA